MTVKSPAGQNLRYRFTTVDQMLTTPVQEGQPWRLVDENGDTIAGGWGTGAAPDLAGSCAYIPFAQMTDGNYGYSIDSGAAVLTEDADGILIEMTASTSFQITLTGLGPTTGAYFLAQALTSKMTISAPVAPAAGDIIWIRGETDAANYSEASIEYDGAIWEIQGSRVIAGVYATASATLGNLAGSRVWGPQWFPATGIARIYRAVLGEFYYDTSAGATATTGGVANSTAEDTSAVANTQIYRIGGSVGVGASWTIRMHGFRAVPNAVVVPGLAF